jgi:ketosteroid isomerase-like protein
MTQSHIGTTERETLRWTQQLLDRIEQKDTEALAAALHPLVVLAHPLALSGDRNDAARWQGKDQVLGYFRGAFTMMGRIHFINRRVSVTGGGRTSFVQADGDLTTADGRLYENVYVFRIDWRGGRASAIEEYANPLTFCQTFHNPLCGTKSPLEHSLK